MLTVTKLLVEVCKMKQWRAVGHNIEYLASKADVFSTTLRRVAGTGALKYYLDLKT